MSNFTFVAEVESPKPFYKWHTVRCEGYWTESDGDHIRPGFRFFYPENAWVLTHGKARILPTIPQWLWDLLSEKGEDEWRDQRDDALSERYDDSEEYQCYDFRDDDILF